MFTYMNVARIGTASQGAAAAERSYQGAAKYARERLAMRSVVRREESRRAQRTRLLSIPDVRRMLLTQRVIAEGGRAMVTYASQYADALPRVAKPSRKRA